MTVEVIGLPEREARILLGTYPMLLGLGIFPDSRDPVRFLQEVGYGSPPRSTQSSAARPALFAQAIREIGSSFPCEGHRIVGVLSSNLLNSACVVTHSGPMSPVPSRGVPEVQPPIPPSPRPFRIQGFATAAEAERHMKTDPTEVVIVLGLGRPTPILVGLCESPCARSSSGVLAGSITRRPGIVTPYDLSVTILRRLGVTPIPVGFAGNVLHAEPDPDAAARIESLTARLERDDSFAPGLAAVTVTLGVGSIIVGLGLAGLGRRRAGARVAQAAVFVLPGWVVATFVPSGRWEVRSAIVLAAVLIGAALRPRQPVRTMANVGFASAVAFAVLVAVAPLNPGGEPGLSIWGNPLVSWRFFGLQNVPAAIIASGVVVWGVIRGLSPVMLAAIASAAALVIGAPAIGANFVGVLTFVFGATAAIVALVRRRASVRQIALSGTIGVGAFVLALLADAGSPVSHGGRAAQRISSDGWSAAWDLIEGRLRLNAELIREFTGGPLWVLGLLVTLVALIVWGMRAEQWLFRPRIAVLGGALMALSSLVLEDSGFYSGAVLWFVAADAWLLVTLSGVTVPSEPPGAAG